MRCPSLSGPVKNGPSVGWYYCDDKSKFVTEAAPPGHKPGLAPDVTEKCLERRWCGGQRVVYTPILVPPKARTR